MGKTTKRQRQIFRAWTLLRPGILAQDSVDTAQLVQDWDTKDLRVHIRRTNGTECWLNADILPHTLKEDSYIGLLFMVRGDDG